MAEKRLERCIKSLERSKRLSDYERVFENWLEDIIEKVEPFNEDDFEHFLPHHHIFIENSTTIVRHVSDGSARQRNCSSLNDCLEKGPTLIELIPSLISKFRFKKIGVISDIEKTFLQIEIQENDRKYLKFLWWEHGQKLQCFQHKIVVFGISSSPFLLGATIECHLNNSPPHLMETAFKLKNSFYVDNYILSINSVEECSKLISELQALMSTAKFNLRGWK
ncbi:integrase catalytic domain-containing protein [Trichonephila clavipes]|nr:integrase catalytic domain-containing protein [Trichonephila clavipes]